MLHLKSENIVAGALLAIITITIIIVIIIITMMSTNTTIFILINLPMLHLEGENIVAGDLLAWLGEGAAVSCLRLYIIESRITNNPTTNKTHLHSA